MEVLGPKTLDSVEDGLGFLFQTPVIATSNPSASRVLKGSL